MQKNKFLFSRDMTLIYLWDLDVVNKYPKGISQGQLSRESGVSYKYLGKRLSYWCEEGFINKKIGHECPGHPVYLYCLARRGETLVGNMPQERFRAIVDEIKKHRVEKEIVK